MNHRDACLAARRREARDVRDHVLARGVRRSARVRERAALDDYIVLQVLDDERSALRVDPVHELAS